LLFRVSSNRPLPADRPAPTGEVEPAEPVLSQRRDVVVIEPARPTSPPVSHSRPQAAFVAHLIATAHQDPQTREKRRAAPQEASDRYVAAGKPRAVNPGRSFKRAI